MKQFTTQSTSFLLSQHDYETNSDLRRWEILEKYVWQFPIIFIFHDMEEVTGIVSHVIYQKDEE